MSNLLLSTKLYAPPARAGMVQRTRLNQRLTHGLSGRLTVVCAPAGSGKTTLVSAWAAACPRPVAWLSLDEEDNDVLRLLAYLVAAVQTVVPQVGDGLLEALQSPQPPPVGALLTALVNDIAAEAGPMVLVLDDYHVLETPAVEQALAFWLEHVPAHVHVVLITREAPRLPLARWRVRHVLTEVGAADLRFTPAEAAEFLRVTMGLRLSEHEVAALEARTEGWAAGLQMAALSLQNHPDAGAFIAQFTGGHRHVLDYLVDEVLSRQTDQVQMFLLRSALLDRFCGPLCDAVLGLSAGTGHATLTQLERANLFIVPLDDERRWYRYHHLFGGLLRQHLLRSLPASELTALHLRASRWYASQGLDAEAFEHAVTSGDMDYAAQLVEGDGMPLPFRGVVQPVVRWLGQLPPAALDARPALWVIYAATLLVAGQLSAVEPLVQAAEAALQAAPQDERTRDLIGHVASIRATLAVSQRDGEAAMRYSLRALEHLHPANLTVRTATAWTLGYAHHMRGEAGAAMKAYLEAADTSRRIGHHIILMMATMGVAMLQEEQGRHDLASETYHKVIALASDPPQPVVSGAYLGLARIHAARGAWANAHRLGQEALRLGRQLESTDQAALCEAFLADLAKRRTDDGGLPVLLDALSAREHEVLRLIADGLSNHEIGERLFLALDTVKGHNRRIFEKLGVQRRTEAVARARELGLL